jgi:hypothetical protein
VGLGLVAYIQRTLLRPTISATMLLSMLLERACLPTEGCVITPVGPDSAVGRLQADHGVVTVNALN